jgi:glycogen debranching enzyme
MANLGEVPFGRYYGSVDATPLFVLLAGHYYRATADVSLIAEIWPQIERALAWMESLGDRDGDGFLEYESDPAGLVHQGWKDSHDSVFHADGSDAHGPVALCEVQGYTYGAYRHAAGLASLLGHHERARYLQSLAAGLKTRFEEQFWCEELGTYAIALDGDKRPCRVRASNAGHCLFTGLVSRERATQLAQTLFEERSFSGWGIRTLARGEARHNPMSYHNGSIWPHDNALIGAGLADYGFRFEALRILLGLYESTLYFETKRLPELFCGFPRAPGAGPTIYPVACSPQAWAAGAPLLLLKACLGLSIDAPNRRIQFSHPVLPPFLHELSIHGLRVGDSSIDLIVHRYPEDVGINVLRRTGPIEVVNVK